MHHDTCHWVLKISDVHEKKFQSKKADFRVFSHQKHNSFFGCFSKVFVAIENAFLNKWKSSMRMLALKVELHMCLNENIFVHPVLTKVDQIFHNSNTHIFVILSTFSSRYIWAVYIWGRKPGRPLRCSHYAVFCVFVSGYSDFWGCKQVLGAVKIATESWNITF